MQRIKISVPDNAIDNVRRNLEGIGGWQHRHLPSAGHWIEIDENAKQARDAINLCR
jgi:hypothetical protein